MGDLGQATRPIMWNISEAWLMYVLFLVALGVFAFGLHRRVSFWRKGRSSEERLGDWGRRATALLKELLFQKRVRGSRFPGIFHSLIFYSFAVLVVTTAVVALDFDFGTNLFEGYLYVALTIGAELGGVLILVGVGMAYYRRRVLKPATLKTTTRDMWPLLLVAAITVTGFLAEGIRIGAIGDQWAALTPVGYALSLPFVGMSGETAAVIHKATWWVHAVLVFGWIATIPFTKFAHLLSLPTNVFFAKLNARGELTRPDIMAMMEDENFDEDNFNLGVEFTGDLTWKQRLDMDACIECGRCTEVCPATQAGHPFSPKDFIQNSLELVRRADTADNDDDANPAIIGNAFDDQFVWYCRTCMACMEVCPAAIDHVDSFVDLRRNEVMMQGRAPVDALRALKMLENRGNPFGPQSERVDWLNDLGVRVVKPGEQIDVVYWIGCCTTFDPTKQKIAADLCQLLDRCGIEYGVLGADERCCGDPARLLGEERLFQEVALTQVEALKARDFKVLLTSCPHCYNVLKHEYPQFGGDFNVVHHSEFIHEMLWGGELFPKLGLARKLVYHDPCYLGRYQKQYESPREVLKALPGVQIEEMKDHHERSMCCGGGGGHFWMDLKSAERVNSLRVQQAQDAGADTIVTACAYCKQMLDDSVKTLDLDDDIEVIDLASLVWSSLEREDETAKRLEDEAEREDKQAG